MITATTMPIDPGLAAQYRLLSWLSPGYPVGSYTYSHGLDYAVDAGWVTEAATTEAWIADALTHGGGFTDAVLLVHAHAAPTPDYLAEVAELAAALPATEELALESRAQGRAFLEITAQAWPTEAIDRVRAAWDGPVAYPVAVGAVGAGHGIPASALVAGYLHAFAANLVSAAQRLVPLGQTDGQRILARLTSTVHETADRALDTRLADIGGAAVLIDIASALHETQYTRLFRS